MSQDSPYVFDNYGNDGTFPYTCTTCGVTCESIKELSDPDIAREIAGELTEAADVLERKLHTANGGDSA